MHTVKISTRSSKGFLPQPANAWGIILLFALITVVGLITGLGKVLNFAFPAGALGVGLVLYFRYPVLYLGFTWWLWFLTPLVRRLADYRSGYTEPSPILLAPFLVTLITAITFLKILPVAIKKGCLPYLLSLTGIAYGFMIGWIKVSIMGIAVSLLSWLAPVLFSCHLFLNWRDYPSYRDNIQRVFLWGALVSGAYGIVQYIVPPEWDLAWLRNLSADGSPTSFGIPEPLGLRVWSTMHGPGVFGVVMMAALLMLLSNVRPLSLPATIVGYLSFLLCAVRSAWVGWFIGLLNLITALKPKFQMRLTLMILIGSMCIVPLTTIEPFADVIGPRLESFANLQEDGSGRERQENYDKWLTYATKNVMGDGIGNNPGLLDSAVLEMMIGLGWLGSALYGGGLVLLLLKLVMDTKLRGDMFASTARSIAVGMFSQLIFGSIMLGLPGMMLWGFMGAGLAAQKYHQHSESNR
jgi:hypothetical protein